MNKKIDMEEIKKSVSILDKKISEAIKEFEEEYPGFHVRDVFIYRYDPSLSTNPDAVSSIDARCQVCVTRI